MRRKRKWSAAALVGLIAATFHGLESSAANSPRLTMTVVVYNYAAIPTKTLGDTKRVAGRVLSEAGVETRWRNAPLEHAGGRNGGSWADVFGPSTLVLRLLSEEMTERLGFPSNRYGFALALPDGGFSSTASVFCQRAQRLTNGTPSLVPMILGNLMAHEIGHLLLGPHSHSSQGIMREPWGRREIQIARRSGLRFTATEAARIRSSVLARIEVAATQVGADPSEPGTEPKRGLLGL